MINHLVCHAAIDADVLARDESCFVGAEVEHHVGNIHRIAHTACWLLSGIGTLIHVIGGVYPTRRDGVDTYFASGEVPR